MSRCAGGRWRESALLRRLRTEDAGFSLIEVLAAMVVLALMAAAVVTGLVTSSDLTRSNRARVTAANLAAKEMDLVRNIAVKDVPVGASPARVETVNGVAYTVQRQTTWEASPTTIVSNRCSGTYPGRFAYKRVAVAVTWPRMGTVTPVRSDTILAPPAGTMPADAGVVRVRVTTRDGSPLPGQTATLYAGASPLGTQTTDSYGCAVFADLSDGVYSVAVDTPPNVDQAGVQQHAEAVSVTGGTTSPNIIEFPYDRAASVAATPTVTAGYPAPVGLGLTVYNASATRKVAAGGTGATTTLAGLFPFVDGYQAWAGTCTDADPAFYGAGRRAPVATAPGGSASASVDTRPVSLKVKYGTGASQTVDNTPVYAVHVQTTGCGPVANRNPSNSTQQVGESYPLGNTDTSGVRLASLPYGTWTIQVQGRTPDPSWPVVTLTPSSTTGTPAQTLVQVN